MPLQIPMYMNIEEVQKLFNVMDRQKWYVCFRTIFYLGLRNSELCKLKVEHIDLQSRRVLIRASKDTTRKLYRLENIRKLGYSSYTDVFKAVSEDEAKIVKLFIDINNTYSLLPETMAQRSGIDLNQINQLSDSLMKRGILKTVEKGKDRTVPLPQHLANEIIQFLGERRAGYLIEPDTKYMKYRTWKESYINPESIRFQFKKYLRKAGFSKDQIEVWHVHTLRHSYATYLLQEGVDMTVVQQVLGHSDIKTTVRTYIHLNDKDRLRAIDNVFGYTKNDGYQAPRYGGLSNSPQNRTAPTMNIQETISTERLVEFAKTRLATGEINVNEYKEIVGSLQNGNMQMP